MADILAATKPYITNKPSTSEALTYIMTIERKIVLAKTENWDFWIAIIQMKAQTLKIWEKINPNTKADAIPAALVEPVAPRMIIPVDGPIPPGQLDIHKRQGKIKFSPG